MSVSIENKGAVIGVVLGAINGVLTATQQVVSWFEYQVIPGYPSLTYGVVAQTAILAFVGGTIGFFTSLIWKKIFPSKK